jgi:hypothetical protein
MTGGMAMFQSELRTAVREAREAPTQQSGAGPEARPVAGGGRRPAPSPAGRRSAKRVAIRLWLPLTPLWILLAPFALLLIPLLLLTPPLFPNRPGARALRASIAARPFRTAFGLGAVLIALSGTVVDVDTPDALVRIRIF